MTKLDIASLSNISGGGNGNNGGGRGGNGGGRGGNGGNGGCNPTPAPAPCAPAKNSHCS